MTALSTGGHLDPGVERRVSRYRRLLVLYPREFRADFGDDLVQAYRDLLVFSTGRRGLWWRTTRDLLTSAARERGESLRPANRGPNRAPLALTVLVIALFVAGGGFFLLPAVILVGLPIFALTRFIHAARIRRATGGSIGRPVLIGTVSLLPAGAALAYLGNDAGYFLFIGIGASLIIAASAGILWVGYHVFRRTDQPRPRARLALVLVPSIAVLTFIIGASVNSYLDSLGPPGDHSVENASAETRALWQAAHDGDLHEVLRLTTETCADPWVKFPYGNGRHNAKGMAETRGWSTSIAAPFGEIADLLGDYQNGWYERCGKVDD